MRIENEKLSQETVSHDLDATKKRALRILGKRSFSEREMVKRLVSKGEDERDAEEAVKWLAELGYIDDSQYATLIVNHYTAKGYGQARIRDELSKRGVPRDMWEEKMAMPFEADVTGHAVEFLRKKLKGSVDKGDLRRATEALVRRGFSYDEAREAINKYSDETK